MRIVRDVTGILKQPIVWILFFFLGTLVYTLRHRSLQTRFRILRAFAWLIHGVAFGPRARIRKNLSFIRPDLSEAEINRGSWRVTKAIAWSWAAMLGNGRSSPPLTTDDTFTVEGIEPLVVCHKAGKKIIAVVGHVGPVDDMFRIFSLHDLRAYIPVEHVKPAWLLDIMTRSRAVFGDVILEPVERKYTLDRARSHLSSGRIVVLTIDVTKKDKRGVRCRIGDGEAWFPVGAVKLGLEEDAMIFPVFPSWDNQRRIRIVVSTPFEFIKTDDSSRDIEINTRRLIENVYGPHIQAHWDMWLRALWAHLEPVKNKNNASKSLS